MFDDHSFTSQISKMSSTSGSFSYNISIALCSSGASTPNHLTSTSVAHSISQYLSITYPSFKFHLANTASCNDCAYLPTLNSAGSTVLLMIIFSTGLGLYFSSVKIGAYLSFVRLTLISSSSNLINAVSWLRLADGVPYHLIMCCCMPVISDISDIVPMNGPSAPL